MVESERNCGISRHFRSDSAHHWNELRFHWSVDRCEADNSARWHSVDHLIQGGPADQVGIEVGDDILALGGVYVFTAQELMDNLHRYAPGSRVALRFRRRSTIYDTFVVMDSERARPDAAH